LGRLRKVAHERSVAVQAVAPGAWVDLG